MPNSTVIPVLIYPDVREAVAWLTKAFGFTERLQIGDNHRSQMTVPGGGAVVAADARGSRRPPREGESTSSVMIRVEDADAHCERARDHGANIVAEPADHVYGERQYTAVDPWGHVWTFTETIADADPASFGGILREP
jgi:uncharacterized glyoxalase superfamily protein PhnB